MPQSNTETDNSVTSQSVVTLQFSSGDTPDTTYYYTEFETYVVSFGSPEDSKDPSATVTADIDVNGNSACTACLVSLDPNGGVLTTEVTIGCINTCTGDVLVEVEDEEEQTYRVTYHGDLQQTITLLGDGGAKVSYESILALDLDSVYPLSDIES